MRYCTETKLPCHSECESWECKVREGKQVKYVKVRYDHVNVIKEHIDNAMLGKPIDKNNRDDNGLEYFPDMPYIIEQIKAAQKLLKDL